MIVDRPEVKRCWENYSQGTYSIELTFIDDLTFQLKDVELQHVLASEACASSERPFTTGISAASLGTSSTEADGNVRPAS